MYDKQVVRRRRAALAVLVVLSLGLLTVYFGEGPAGLLHGLQRGAQSVHITGLDDVHHFYQPAARRALDEPQDGFRIALVHSAEMADHAAAAGVGSIYAVIPTAVRSACPEGGRSSPS